MLTNYDALQLEVMIANQASLARIALSPEVRAMHLELEALYRSQLICAVASETLFVSLDETHNLKLAA